MNMLRLNLGCGQDIRSKEEGWVNIDRQQGRGIDMVYNMHETPLPFGDSTVDHALASHVLEHMHDWEALMIDVHRMLKPGGTFEIRVPYGVNPTAYHVRFFDEHTMDLFLDMGPREPGGGLDPCAIFDLVSVKVNRRFPFRWHLIHYLHVKPPYSSPVGPKAEIVWMMRKKQAQKTACQE